MSAGETLSTILPRFVPLRYLKEVPLRDMGEPQYITAFSAWLHRTGLKPETVKGLGLAMFMGHELWGHNCWNQMVDCVRTAWMSNSYMETLRLLSALECFDGDYMGFPLQFQAIHSLDNWYWIKHLNLELIRLYQKGCEQWSYTTMISKDHPASNLAAAIMLYVDFIPEETDDENTDDENTDDENTDDENTDNLA